MDHTTNPADPMYEPGPHHCGRCGRRLIWVSYIRPRFMTLPEAKPGQWFHVLGSKAVFEPTSEDHGWAVVHEAVPVTGDAIDPRRAPAPAEPDGDHFLRP